MPSISHSSDAWKPVVGFESIYDVSTRGEIFSHLSNRLLRPRKSGDYLGVSLRKDGKTHPKYLHHLVVESFIGPRPAGFDICHGNGNRHDNRVENLRYDTHHENMRESVAHGTHRSVGRTHCVNGHERTEANTYHRERVSGDGGIKRHDDCRACIHAANVRYAAKKAARQTA